MAQLNKRELTKILVEEYGYEKEDLKDKEGKAYTNAQLQQMIKQEEEDAKQLEIDEHRVLSKKTKLKDDDKIAVMSGLMGTVVYRSDISRRQWRFTRFGQVESIPYGELVTIQNRFPSYFRECWLVVLDKEVQDEFGLTEQYKNILTPENIDSVFKMEIEELIVFVDNLPEGMKNTFINKAQELHSKKELYDVRVINMIQDKFQFSLEDNSPINDLALEGKQKGNVIYVNKA
ncbi:hypothetical protein Q7A53_06150 [Halobacillus rhizosphaerae]|uniref:hypothetical protein n=1 Tax=Halobacillus rhizosphaerae TaxID=3064889 RepID=UPI00398AEE9F